MKEEYPISITFDSSAYQMLRKLLGVKSFHCKYCNRLINKNNIGGFTKDKNVFCKNFVCLTRFVVRNDKQWEDE